MFRPNRKTQHDCEKDIVVAANGHRDTTILRRLLVPSASDGRSVTRPDSAQGALLAVGQVDGRASQARRAFAASGSD